MRETSVSNIDLYKMWKNQDELDLSWLLMKLAVRKQTEAMMAGEAFHKAVEYAPDGEFSTLSALDYQFRFCGDYELALPKLRESSLSREYSGLLVKGRVDGLGASVVHDLKTTEQFDPDRYLERMAWRFYLDIWGAKRFEWHIFQVKETGRKQYDVYAYHHLVQYGYQGLHEDCLRAAEEYRDFAGRFLGPSQK